MGEEIIKINLDSLPEISKGSGLWAMMDETDYSKNNFPIEELRRQLKSSLLLFRPEENNTVSMEDLLNSPVLNYKAPTREDLKNFFGKVNNER